MNKIAYEVGKKVASSKLALENPIDSYRDFKDGIDRKAGIASGITGGLLGLLADRGERIDFDAPGVRGIFNVPGNISGTRLATTPFSRIESLLEGAGYKSEELKKLLTRVGKVPRKFKIPTSASSKLLKPSIKILEALGKASPLGGFVAPVLGALGLGSLGYYASDQDWFRPTVMEELSDIAKNTIGRD